MSAVKLNERWKEQPQYSCFAIDIVDNTLPPGSNQTAGTDPSTVDVPAGANVTELDGYQPPPPPPGRGTVQGVVFDDADGNGNQTATGNATKLGLPNVTVVITDTQGATYTVTTGADGAYSQEVPAGTTSIKIVDSTLPTGAQQMAGENPTTILVPDNATVPTLTGISCRRAHS